MTASVEILTNKKDNVMSVPLAAVTTRNPNELKVEEEKSQGGPPSNSNRAEEDKKDQNKKKEDKIVVFVNEKGVAKMVEVKTGISDYDNIEIVDGLKDSTEVVIGPFLAVSKRLKEGDKIRMKPKDDSNKDKEKSEK
jgi:HlyD family secretion protein